MELHGAMRKVESGYHVGIAGFHKLQCFLLPAQKMLGNSERLHHVFLLVP